MTASLNGSGWSTLEPVSPGALPVNREKLLPAEAKQLAFVNEKEISRPYDGLQVVNGPEEAPEKHASALHQLQTLPRNKWILWSGGLLTAIIVLAVLAAVFATRHAKPSTHDASLSAANSTAASSSTPSTTVSAAVSSTGVATTSGSPSPIARSLAAVSYTSNSDNTSRVYFQNTAGEVVEALSAARNTSWSSQGIGFSPQNGSALAAAVSRPGFPLEISVVYTDNNAIIHDMVFDGSSDTWSPGTLAAAQYQVSLNSSLSIMYNQCALCANTTIVAFQDTGGFIQIANSTSTGNWSLTELNAASQLGTGLALHPFYRAGLPDQINILYQQSETEDLILASWNPLEANKGVITWNPLEQTYSSRPTKTPIASATSYTNVSTGYETWIEVVTVTSTGLKTDTWSGELNDWLVHDVLPAAMSNSSSSTAGGQSFGAVAVTSIGQAFAVASTPGQKDVIRAWQVADDTLDWNDVGNVDVGDAWG